MNYILHGITSAKLETSELGYKSPRCTLHFAKIRRKTIFQSTVQEIRLSFVEGKFFKVT